MILRQIFTEPIDGYWNGGSKISFDWKIEHSHMGHDRKGTFVRIGSWRANHWFHVAVGKSDKITLSNARRRLSRLAKKANKVCTFEYIEY